MQHLRTSRSSLAHGLGLVAALTTGCLAEADSDTPGAESDALELDADTSKAATRQLRCVASPTDDMAAIWRLTITRATTGYQVSASRELQFPHDLDLSGNPIPDTTVVEEAAFTARASGSVGTRSISLSFAQGRLSLTAKAGQRGNIYAGTATLSAETSLPVTCWGSWVTPEFRYQAASGVCQNVTGVAGKNALPIEMIRETGNGECATFSGVLNDRDAGYPVLRNWNLRGVDFTGVALSFGILVDADLRGARFDTIDGGYYVMTGTVDGFSRHEESCTVASDKVHCVR